MSKDDLIAEFRNSGASWPAVVGVYGILLGTLVVSASMMV